METVASVIGNPAPARPSYSAVNADSLYFYQVLKDYDIGLPGAHARASGEQSTIATLRDVV